MLIAFTPAGKMEEFLRITAVPHPPVQDDAFFRRYEMELVGLAPGLTRACSSFLHIRSSDTAPDLAS